MKQISVIGKEVENKNGQQPCKLLVTSFDTNDLDLQPPPPFPEKRPKSTTVTQRPTSFLENIKVRFNFVLFLKTDLILFQRESLRGAQWHQCICGLGELSQWNLLVLVNVK